jgi:hypothetical protein
VVQQQLVELRADHLERLRRFAGLGENDLPFLWTPEEVHTVLGLESVLGHLFPDAQQFEYRLTGRQDRLADMVPREMVPLGHGHLNALFGNEPGGRRARRPAADDENPCRLAHINLQLLHNRRDRQR